MNYGQQILGILCEAGEAGLSVHKIAMHVHNACNSFFAPLRPDNVHRDVQAWLLRNSRTPDAPVCRCGKRGYYRINLNSTAARQLLLDFDSELSPGQASVARVSANGDEGQLSLALFDDKP